MLCYVMLRCMIEAAFNSFLKKEYFQKKEYKAMTKKHEIIEISKENGCFLLISIPDTAANFSIEEYFLSLSQFLHYYIGKELVKVQLPRGINTILTTTDAISEEHMHILLSGYWSEDFKCWDNLINIGGICDTQLECFETFKSKYLINGRYLIIQNIS